MTRTTLRRMLRQTPMRDLVRGRITGRLDIEKLLNEAGLSGQAADKVRRVVKYTRLWRLEKVDVARELIAHFTDGQEANVPLDELVETFGDERQTAKLIRRAKKRQRPVPWHVFAWVRLCLLVFFGVYLLAALYLLTGSPSVTTDYLAKLNSKAAAVPAEEAAWPLYREALLEMRLRESREWDSPDPYYAELPETEREEVDPSCYEPPYITDQMSRLILSLHPDDPGWGATAAFLNEHADSIALIRRGASRHGLGLKVGFETDYSATDRQAMSFHVDPALITSQQGKTFRDPDRALIGVLLPHLSRMRDLARLLGADALRSAGGGDADTALADIKAIHAIARHANEHPLLINGLVGISIHQMSYRTIEDVLINDPGLWSDQQLRDLAHELASVEHSHEEWFNVERLWFYDYLQRTYTDNGQGGGVITREGIQDFGQYNQSRSPSSAVAIAGLPAASVLVAPRDEMKRVYDEMMDQAIIEGYKPLWELDYEQTVGARIENMKESYLSQMRYLPILLFMPAMSVVNRTIQNEAGYREGVMIGIALELYRRKHGDWPGALEDMVPGYLPGVPVDRLTGEPVRYIVAEDGPVVYSLGVDGDDDGGRPPVEKDGDLANDMAGPKQFTGEVQTETAYDGDWLLWPVPDAE